MAIPIKFSKAPYNNNEKGCINFNTDNNSISVGQGDGRSTVFDYSSIGNIGWGGEITIII